MERTVANYVVRQLAAWNIPYIFGLAGDTIIPLLEAIRRQNSIRYIGVRHEESAGFMASAYAKLTGKPGVCLAEAGPASVHLLNGVYDAHMDRVPLLALTGESASYLLGSHWPQTINQDLLYRDATCFNMTLTTDGQLPDALYLALRMAVINADASRVGIPVDLQTKLFDAPVRPFPQYLISAAPRPDDSAIAQAVDLLKHAQRPVLLVGQGARGYSQQVLELAEKLQAAVIHTMPAIGIIPARHPRNLGVIGDFGTEPAAEAFAQADVVMVIGSTWWQPKYVPDAHFIQIDRTARHLGMLFPLDVGILGDIKDVLPAINSQIKTHSRPEWDGYVKRLAAGWQQKISSGTAGFANGKPVSNGYRAVRPHTVMRALQQQLKADAIICLDVGDNTYWFSSLFQSQEQRVLLSGHWRSMGFALPAAIAAKLVAPEKHVVAIAGDGGFAMTMAEFTTAVSLNLPIVVIIMNNRAFGHEGHLQSKVRLEPFGIGLHNPDFSLYAQACGADGYRVESESGLQRALTAAFKSERPTIIDVATERLMPAFPEGKGTLQPAVATASAPYDPAPHDGSR